MKHDGRRPRQRRCRARHRQQRSSGLEPFLRVLCCHISHCQRFRNGRWSYCLPQIVRRNPPTSINLSDLSAKKRPKKTPGSMARGQSTAHPAVPAPLANSPGLGPIAPPGLPKRSPVAIPAHCRSAHSKSASPTRLAHLRPPRIDLNRKPRNSPLAFRHRDRRPPRAAAGQRSDSRYFR
jgi:hypothetical protein